MKRLVWTVLALAFSAPLLAQEVVIFKDHRSLVIQSHRTDKEWTYLRVGNGELAVRSSEILQFTQEKGALPLTLPPSAPQPAVQRGFPGPTPPSRPGFVPERPPTPPPAEPEEEEPEEDLDEEVTTEDEPPPEKEGEKKPQPPAGFARPNLNLDKPIPMNQASDEGSEDD
ncbi:MAG: hypothetical protein ACOYXN_04785 [Acidobacteriota bacterium]